MGKELRGEQGADGEDLVYQAILGIYFPVDSGLPLRNAAEIKWYLNSGQLSW